MKNCFVLMPFKTEFDLVYEVIEKTCKSFKINCIRADKKKELGLITQGIIKDILLADLIIVDISEYNPNVLYELGIAHVVNKPTILLSQELAASKELPFDIKHMSTIGYIMPITKSDINAKKLKSNIGKFLNAPKINLNPVSITLQAERINLSNYFCQNFLWGYDRTLSESIKADEAWVVSSKLFWERLDGLYFSEIMEKRLLTGLRKEFVLLSDTRENRDRKDAFLKKHIVNYPTIENNFRILLLDNELPFYFLSTEITIYDADTPNVRAIILEPMALEGVDEGNDNLIAEAIKGNNIYNRKYYNLKENTFDIVLPKLAAEKMAGNFKKMWNYQCIKMEKKSWII